MENGFVPSESPISRLDGGAGMLVIFGPAILAPGFDSAAGLSTPKQC
jgi:hypothetical protein